MRAPAKLAAYGAVLAIMVGGGAGIGAAAGPIDVGDDAPHEVHAAPSPGPAPADEARLPAPSRRAEVDGYDVALAGDVRPGASELTFTVSRAGEAVRTEPHLGAAGHLVAVRAGDLAYAHVHPLEGGGDEVRFTADLPGPGTYRLFLDFAHGGEVHTAAFTVDVPGADTTTDPPAAGDEHESH